MDDFTPPEDFSTYKEDIEHGTLADLYYPTDYRESDTAHARVWFPPNYDVDKKYNLLLCLHGGSDTEYYWTAAGGGSNDGCNAGNVLDNLYATGQMEDTIVVFPHGVIPYDANREYPNIVANPLLDDFWINHYLLEFEIINNLLPYVRSEYPVYDTSDHTGICGLSMGCAQTMEIAFKNPTLFDYVSPFSAGPFGDTNQTFITCEEDSAVLNSEIKLLLFQTGEYDSLHDNSLRKFLKHSYENKLEFMFNEVPKVGHDDYCWDKCLYAFMKYAFK